MADARPGVDHDTISPRRALLSVSDKAGIVELARELAMLGVELVSTGGTARLFAEEGLSVTSIEDLTGFPEMLSGRVKTLHPNVHGGILARRTDPEHVLQLDEHGIQGIDLVVVNLYPFESTVAKVGVTEPECIEQIDIGGPAMIRSAAKNHESVAVVVGPEWYPPLIGELKEHGGTTMAFRRTLAAEAFARTAAYDAVIASYLSEEKQTPERLTLTYQRSEELRYGENPHQPASVYREATLGSGSGVLGATLLGGKPLSFNNLNDAQAAWSLATAGRGIDDRPTAVVVKHANPCGFATADSAIDAIDRAIEGDPMASFGGILAIDGVVDLKTAEWLVGRGGFFEVLVAEGYEAGTVEALAAKWPNLRVLSEPGREDAVRQVRALPGGLLVQAGDALSAGPELWTRAAGPEPSDDVLRAAASLEAVTRALASNAVCIGRCDGDVVELVGAGAGQMDRVAACRNAIEKAGARARAAVVFSDAFFPFADGPELLIEAGVAAIVHPGGSKRDGETFELCESRGVTCLTTNVRHFRH